MKITDETMHAALQRWRDEDHEDTVALSREQVIDLCEEYRAALEAAQLPPQPDLEVVDILTVKIAEVIHGTAGIDGRAVTLNKDNAAKVARSAALVAQALTAALPSAGEEEETRQARVEHFETPTLAEVIKKARRGEIEDNPPSSGRAPQTIEDYITSPHPTSADKLEVVEHLSCGECQGSGYGGHPDSMVNCGSCNGRGAIPLVRHSDATRIITACQQEVERLRGELIKSRNYWSEQCSGLNQRNAELAEALNQIYALDPEEHLYGVSKDACRGLIARIGEIARAALEGQSNETVVHRADRRG